MGPFARVAGLGTLRSARYPVESGLVVGRLADAAEDGGDGAERVEPVAAYVTAADPAP
ncbi:hypothetical protein [Streptomyces sp. NK08204]|uniref:hypothetical protein n=1 Tax=Streptomyces sp. NK08204 TaxID=2873260 RepID=UPI0027E3588D|nr:hypothetical protein [Streptomyces sp. NK08204]